MACTLINPERVVCACAFCGRRTSLDLMPYEGWTPYFYEGELEVENSTTCPDCAREHLRLGRDGEWELRVSGAARAELKMESILNRIFSALNR